MYIDLRYTRPVVNTVLLKLMEKEGNIIYWNAVVLVLSINGMGYVNKWVKFDLYLYNFAANEG